MPIHPVPSASLLRTLRSINAIHSTHSHHHHRYLRSVTHRPNHYASFPPQPTHRALSTTPHTRLPAPVSRDRGPTSKEDTQTDFGTQDIFSHTPGPAAAIDACTRDGFHLDNGVKIAGEGVVICQGEAFGWRPWEREGEARGDRRGKLVNAKGQWDTEGDGRAAWGLLECVWPKPELLILGLGPSMRPLSPATRQKIHSLGIRVDIQDTRNAAAQFNLLATERGVGDIACALVPVGWRE